MSTDDIFDDDDLDEFDTDSEVDQFDIDDEDDEVAVDSGESQPTAPAVAGPTYVEEDLSKKPFFRNWVWWTSLIAAVPGAILLTSIVLGMKDYGGEFNWMMWITAGGTFFGSAAATVMPLLIALGFFMGGETVSVAEPKTESDSFDDDDDIVADDSDSGVFDDDEDVSDINSGIYKVDGDNSDPGFGGDDFDDDDDDEGTAFEFE